MATSGSLYLSLPSGHRARLSWELTGQSGMYSYIDYTIKWTSEPSTWTAGNIYVDVNGEYTQSYRYYKNAAGGSSGTNIGGGGLSVLRDTATNIGTFYLSITAEGTYQDSNYDNIDYTDYDSNTWKVYTSTKYGSGAQITAVSDFTDETSPTITYSYDRGSSVSAASLFAGVSFNGSTMNLPYREITNITGSYTFNFTEDDLNTLYTLLHNGENASVRFYIKTTEVVNDEIMHIENYLTKTFKFVNYTPVITPTLYDTNPATIALTGNRNNLIRYMSDVHYKMDVELRKGALDVIGCYIQNGGVIEEGFLEGDFDNPTSNVFYFSATDDRGHTGTASKSYDTFWGEFINYIKLTSSLKCTPISGEGDLGINISGKYFNAYFGAAQNQMSLEYAVYKKGTTPQWINAGVIEPEMTDNTTYSYSWNVDNLDYTAQYIVAVKVTDLLMNAEAEISVVAKPVFYWNGEEFVFNVPVKFMAGYTNG